MGATTVLTGASGYVGIGIVGVMIVGNANVVTDKDGRLINCFNVTTTDAVTGKKRIYCVKRPGYAANTTPQAGSIGNVITVWSGQGSGNKIISAFGAADSSIYDGTTQLVTDAADTTKITGKATGITETQISNTPTLTISSSDSTGWYYQPAGTVTKITDTDFPGNASRTLAGTFVHLNGFACIMDTTGRIYASDLNSVTAWTANAYSDSNAYPDNGIGLIRRGQEILSFGTQSIEFWKNQGLSPFPLVRLQEKTIKVGAISADAIAQISDTIFFAGAAPEGGISLFKYDGEVSRISTPEIDAILLIAGASGITLSTERYYGRSLVNVVAGSTTYVYCVEEKDWHEKSSTTILWHKTVAISVGATLQSYAISTTGTGGKVYVINPAAFVFTDDSVVYTARIQPPKDSGDGKRTFYNEFEIIGDRETSASTITLLSTDDDYQTYMTHGTMDLSTARPRMTRLGSGYARGWALSHSAATPFRLEYATIRATQGTA